VSRFRALRTAALIAVVAGSVGSIAFLFRARQHPPRFLMVLFVIWVLAPFSALLVANALSDRWSVRTRTTLYWVMLVVPLGSLAVYGADALMPRTAQPAFVYVLVPPASALLCAMVVATAAVMSSRRSRRGDGA
jgi:hypothetical protein